MSQILFKHCFNNFFKKIIGFFYFLKFGLFQLRHVKNCELVFFFPYYHTGGAERVHLQIVKAYTGKKVCIVFTDLSATKNFLSHFKKLGSVIELNSMKNKKNSIVNNWLSKSIAFAINNNNKIQAVFTSNSFYFYNEILPLLEKSIKKIDVIHAIAPNDHRQNLFAKTADLFLKRVVINNKTKNDLLGIYRKNYISTECDENIIVIPNAVDLINFNFDIKRDYKSFKIGFLGRWSKEKRPHLFLQLANQLNSISNEYHFVMAGIGMRANLNDINEAGVCFLGEIVKENDLYELYKSLDLIVITSEREGFPMVFTEAMFFGVIPITTNVGGIAEHITHLQNGILIESHDEGKVIQNMVYYVSMLNQNKDLCLKLAENSRTYAKNNFLVSKFNQDYQNLLN